MRDYIMEDLLPYLKELGIRDVDYYAIMNLIEDVEVDFLDALGSYQNEDGGFQSLLEPDTRLPLSTVLGTSTATQYFTYSFSKKKKDAFAEKIVEYYENQYDSEDKRFYLTRPEVNDYPHAFWWNYEKLKEWFTYGNPEGFVLGYLNKYSEHIKKLDLNSLNEDFVQFILSEEFLNIDKHAMLNVLSFYEEVDISIKNKIKDRIVSVLMDLIEKDKDEWNNYAFDPYKAYIISCKLFDRENPLLVKNIEHIKDKVENKMVSVPWDWQQYPEEFEKAKIEWLGHIYLQMIYAIYLYEGLD